MHRLYRISGAMLLMAVFVRAPILLAADASSPAKLNKQGWKIESVTFTRTDLNIQALSQGTVQVSIALSIDPLRAVEKGGKIKWIMENTPGEFVMIAKKEIAKCENLTGSRFAIHGETSGTSVAAKRWITDVCKASPTIMVLPGGE